MPFNEPLGKATVDLEAPLGPLERDLAKAQKSVTKTLGNLGRRLTDIGTTMTVGLTLPILAVGASTVSAASDVEEMRSKFDTVFGHLKDGVRDWAEVQARAMNRSKFEFEDYLGSLQDIFVPMGFAREEAAKLSKGLTTLAVDVASFSNAADADVINDFKSALTGSTEVLKKYGIVVNQAALDAELLRQGIEGGALKASQTQKALATYNLILRGTKDAQGDAVKTADSFSNQMKGLKAKVKELQVAIGTDLLPVMTDWVGKLSDGLDKLNEVNPEVRRLGIEIAAVLAILGPALALFGGAARGAESLFKAFRFLKIAALGAAGALTVVIAPPAALAAALSALVLVLWSFRDELKLILKFAWEDIRDFFMNKFLGDEGVAAMKMGLKDLERAWNKFKGIFKQDEEEITKPIRAIPEAVTEAAADMTEGFGAEQDKITTTNAETTSGLKSAWQGWSDSVLFSVDEIKRKFDASFGGMDEKLRKMKPPPWWKEEDTGGVAAKPDKDTPGPSGYTEAEIAADEKTAREAREKQKREEAEFLFDRRQEWLVTKDKQIQSIKEVRDADIAALDAMKLSDDGYLEARKYIWETAAQEIVDIEKAKNDQIIDALKELQQQLRATFEGALTTFIEDLQDGEVEFKKFAASIIDSIKRIAAERLAAQLTEAVFGPEGTQKKKETDWVGLGFKLAGAIAGGIGGAVGGAGAFASPVTDIGGTTGISMVTPTVLPELQHGGPVIPGEDYLVGESGVELFKSDRGGMMVPNAALGDGEVGGGRPLVINQTINTPDANSFRASQNQVAADTAQMLRRADRRGN
jgi:hypothetical protein